ncbi:MAG: hypothetical protein KBC96_06790 [Armatimonadetes bacterium]|nr:hypothetical protein [Armatimonadota bacterium]
MSKGYGLFFAIAILIVIAAGFAYMVQSTNAPMPASDSCAPVPSGGG